MYSINSHGRRLQPWRDAVACREDPNLTLLTQSEPLQSLSGTQVGNQEGGAGGKASVAVPPAVGGGGRKSGRYVIMRDITIFNQHFHNSPGSSLSVCGCKAGCTYATCPPRGSPACCCSSCCPRSRPARSARCRRRRPSRRSGCAGRWPPWAASRRSSKRSRRRRRWRQVLGRGLLERGNWLAGMAGAG